MLLYFRFIFIDKIFSHVCIIIYYICMYDVIKYAKHTIQYYYLCRGLYASIYIF